MIKNTGRMYGALLASQSGRDIDIVNSFDLPLAIDGKDHVVLDVTFLSYKLDQCKTHFFKKKRVPLY